MLPYKVHVKIPPRSPKTAFRITRIFGIMRSAAKRLAPDAHQVVSGHGQLEIHVSDQLTALRLGLINEDALRGMV